MWVLLITATLSRTLIASLLALAAWSLVPVAFGLGSSVVMSDSMAPGIRAGDVVITSPLPAAKVQPGQVLLVDDPDHPGRLRLHRLIAVRHGAFVLRGDANPGNDSSLVPTHALHGAGFLRVPWIGLPVLWLRSGQWVALIIVTAATIAVAVTADLPAALHRRLRRRHRAQPVQRSPRRRHRATALPGSALLLVILLLGQPMTSVEAADAAFSRTTANPSNSWTTQAIYACLGRRTYTGTAPYQYWQYSEDSGTAVLDSSGSTPDHPGTLSNTGARVAGACGGTSPSISLSGGAWISSNTTATTSSSFTIATWIRLNSTTLKSGRLVGLGDGASVPSSDASVDRMLYLDSSGVVHFGLQTTTGTTCDASSASVAITDTNWHHIAATYSAANGMRVLVDGALKTSVGCTGTFDTPAGRYWRVGYDSLSTNYWNGGGAPILNGRVDQTTIWNTELAEAQINTVYGYGH